MNRESAQELYTILTKVSPRASRENTSKFANPTPELLEVSDKLDRLMQVSVVICKDIIDGKEPPENGYHQLVLVNEEQKGLCTLYERLVCEMIAKQGS